MNHLLRSHAPLTDAAWEEIDDEARRQLVPALAARKLVDFSGPKGWSHSATNLGHVTALADAPAKGVSAGQRRVLPLVEVRAAFSLDRADLADIDRGAQDPDFDRLEAAARQVALAENVAVFHGWKAAGITGITQATPHAPVALGDDFAHYPKTVAKAVEVLLEAGMSGPYGLALGPAGYTGVVETTEHGGLIVFDHLRQILGGPIVWAPGVDGAVVTSLRGGDFLLDCGQDLSVGYDHHDADQVHLYLEETFSFQVATPEAAVALTA